MYFLMAGAGFWMASSTKVYPFYSMALWSTGLAGIIGWPFCIVAALPMGLDILIQYGLFSFVKTSILVAGTLIVRYCLLNIAYFMFRVVTLLVIIIFTNASFLRHGICSCTIAAVVPNCMVLNLGRFTLRTCSSILISLRDWHLLPYWSYYCTLWLSNRCTKFQWQEKLPSFYPFTFGSHS